jgi:hypothetical protein
MTARPAPGGAEPADLHRWFAIEVNNATWAALDGIGPASTAAELRQVRYGAYAAAYHGLEAGDEANHARAEYLVAKAELAAGLPEVALAHARRCAELVATHPDRMADWDAPFAQEVLARALAATGDRDAAGAALVEWRRLRDLVADPEDVAVLDAELERAPWFGLRDA